ncbi:hypothetical protein ACIPM0_09465 [Pseudomonas sichuanensis]|uniref:hypothetical protein n=1 Tax=Pseudomonas sichuanensis TaxID=2213015 RepID=UPI0037FFE319
MRPRQWFAAIVQNAEPRACQNFDYLTDEQQDVVHTENVIDVQRDSQCGVTCDLLKVIGISRILDSQPQAGNKRQRSPHEQQNGLTPAGAPAPWNDVRYSL